MPRTLRTSSSTPTPATSIGWDVELAKDVCKVLGVACTINNITFSDIIPALLENPLQVSDELLELHADR